MDSRRCRQDGLHDLLARADSVSVCDELPERALTCTAPKRLCGCCMLLPTVRDLAYMVKGLCPRLTGNILQVGWFIGFFENRADQGLAIKEQVPKFCG